MHKVHLVFGFKKKKKSPILRAVAKKNSYFKTGTVQLEVQTLG